MKGLALWGLEEGHPHHTQHHIKTTDDVVTDLTETPPPRLHQERPSGKAHTRAHTLSLTRTYNPHVLYL